MVKQHSQLMLVIFGLLDLVVTAAAAGAAYGLAVSAGLLAPGASAGALGVSPGPVPGTPGASAGGSSAVHKADCW